MQILNIIKNIKKIPIHLLFLNINFILELLIYMLLQFINQNDYLIIFFNLLYVYQNYIYLLLIIKIIRNFRINLKLSYL